MTNKTVTFGEVSWDSDTGGEDKKSTNNKDLFLRLEEGSNEMRLVTQPYQYLVHKVKKDPNNPKDFGQKVYCSQIHGSCPVCEMGDEFKAKPRWLVGVISRKTGTYKVLDISYAVFGQIRKLARNVARWGDPQKYDIDVIVDKNAPPNGYYAVQPISKEPLSATDQALKDNADTDDLKRRVTPPTADKVKERLARIFGDSPMPTGTSTVKKTEVPKVDMSTEAGSDELEAVFPSYDAE